jgi:hypothetical protein
MIRLALYFGSACALTVAPFAPAINAAPALPGDYNNNGFVSHADFVLWAETPGNFGGDPAGFNMYRANYGRTASSPSLPWLPLTITPLPTMDGNVEWKFSFSDLMNTPHKPFAGHLSIRIDGGPSAPDIVSITPGPSFMAVPGTAPDSFEWLNETEVRPGASFPEGAQYDNSAHEAYAALGTKGATSATNTFTFLTLVTEGQQATSVRVLGGDSISEYGYLLTSTPDPFDSEDYFFVTDQVASFEGAVVPEASTLLAWTCLAAVAVGIGSARKYLRFPHV